MKGQVWDFHIGEEIGKILCLICENNSITQHEFWCGHVVAESNGGKTSVENLRPICLCCYLSMSSTDNMLDFAKAKYPESAIIISKGADLISIPNQFKCPYCPMRFSKDTHLNMHIRMYRQRLNNIHDPMNHYLENAKDLESYLREFFFDILEEGFELVLHKHTEYSLDRKQLLRRIFCDSVEETIFDWIGDEDKPFEPITKKMASEQVLERFDSKFYNRFNEMTTI